MNIDLSELRKLERYLPIVQYMNKAQRAVAEMEKLVKIDEKHNYTRVSDGKWMAGVTSVSGIVPKEWMSAWGAKEAVKALGFSDFEGDTELAEKILTKIKKCKKVEEYLAILKEAKGASARKSKEALVDGTAGHAWVEQFIKANIHSEETPKLPEGMLARPLEQFMKWSENVLAWVISEARVCDVKREYAGTMDALAIMQDGTKAVVDIKFASHVSPEYALQTAGYQACLENYKVNVDKRIIVRLPKTLERQEWNAKEKKYEMIPNELEACTIVTPYEFDRDTFYAALPVKKWCNYVENK